MKYLKKIIICIILLFLSCSYKSCIESMQCNPMLKKAKQGTEDKITDLKEQIKNLESDKAAIEKNRALLGDKYGNLGNKYLDISEWDSAIEAFKKALVYGKTSHIIYYSLGLAYGNKGKMLANPDDYRKAREYYEKSLAIEPDYSSASYALAILLFFEMDEKEKAISILEKLAAEKKSFFIARFALGRFYYETGEVRKSLNVYESLCADLDESPKSEMINDYKKQCAENLSRIRNELQ